MLMRNRRRMSGMPSLKEYGGNTGRGGHTFLQIRGFPLPASTTPQISSNIYRYKNIFVKHVSIICLVKLILICWHLCLCWHLCQIGGFPLPASKTPPKRLKWGLWLFCKFGKQVFCFLIHLGKRLRYDWWWGQSLTLFSLSFTSSETNVLCSGSAIFNFSKYSGFDSYMVFVGFRLNAKWFWLWTNRVNDSTNYLASSCMVKPKYLCLLLKQIKKANAFLTIISSSFREWSGYFTIFRL